MRNMSSQLISIKILFIILEFYITIWEAKKYTYILMKIKFLISIGLVFYKKHEFKIVMSCSFILYKKSIFSFYQFLNYLYFSFFLNNILLYPLFRINESYIAKFKYIDFISYLNF